MVSLTARPVRASSIAAVSPAAPAPITTASGSFGIAGIRLFGGALQPLSVIGAVGGIAWRGALRTWQRPPRCIPLEPPHSHSRDW